LLWRVTVSDHGTDTEMNAYGMGQGDEGRVSDWKGQLGSEDTKSVSLLLQKGNARCTELSGLIVVNQIPVLWNCSYHFRSQVVIKIEHNGLTDLSAPIWSFEPPSKLTRPFEVLAFALIKFEGVDSNNNASVFEKQARPVT
jgi:hypothetical protein